MDGRLCCHDKVSDDHTDRNQKPSAPQLRQPLSYQSSDRHKSNVRSGKENRKPNERISKTNQNSYNLTFTECTRYNLKKHKERKDGRKCDGNFCSIISKAFQICKKYTTRIGDLFKTFYRIFHVMNMKDNSENKYGNNRTDA